MKIYLSAKGKAVGPYTLEQTQGFLDRGKIHARSPAIREGESLWITVEEILGDSKGTLDPPTPSDSRSNPEEIEKPQLITLGVNLIYAALGLSLLSLVFFAVFGGLPKEGERVFWTAQIGSLIFTAFLVLMINAGRNWARVTFSVLFVIGLYSTVQQAISLFEIEPIIGIYSSVQISFSFIALLLFLTKDANLWFKRMKQRNRTTIER